MPVRYKVFVTKQALSNGILVKFVDDIYTSETPIKVYDNESDISTSSYVSLEYVHPNIANAKEHAEKMRDTELASLQAQMKHLYLHEIKVIE